MGRPGPGRPERTCGMLNEKQTSSQSGWGTHRLGEELLLNSVGAWALSAEGDRTTGPAPMCVLQECRLYYIRSCDLNSVRSEHIFT